MKGVMFTEFLDMVAQRYSEDMVDDIIEDSDLPSGGAYTSVGTYEGQELWMLVGALSKRTGALVPDILRAAGHHLFRYFFAEYSRGAHAGTGSFAFLSELEALVQEDVHKLEPGVEVPEMQTIRLGPDQLQIVFRSPNGLSYLLEGIMRASFDHFDEQVDMNVNVVDDGHTAYFNLVRKGEGNG